MANVRRPITENMVYCDILYRIARLSNCDLQAYLSEIHRTYFDQYNEQYAKSHPVLLKQIKVLKDGNYITILNDNESGYKVKYIVNYQKISAEFLLHFQKMLDPEIKKVFKTSFINTRFNDNIFLQAIFEGIFIEFASEFLTPHQNNLHDSENLTIQNIFDDILQRRFLLTAIDKYLDRNENDNFLNNSNKLKKQFEQLQDFIAFIEGNHTSKSPISEFMVYKGLEEVYKKP